MMAVVVVMRTLVKVAPMPSSCGDRTNTYGMINAAMPSFDAFTPVFSGSPPELQSQHMLPEQPAE